MDFKRKNNVGGLADPASPPTPSDPTVDQLEAQAKMVHAMVTADREKPEPAETVPEETPEPAPTPPGIGGKVLAKSRYLLQLYGGLLIAFLAFYALADWTSFTTAEQRPGQLIFSNTMTQLWTACFRLAFVLGASLGLLRLLWPELFRFFRPDTNEGPDMMTTIKYELTSYQRLCVFLLAFFGLCYLFIQLLSVNLPQTISVGR